MRKGQNSPRLVSRYVCKSCLAEGMFSVSMLVLFCSYEILLWGRRKVLTKEGKWEVTCDLTKDTGELGSFSGTVLTFEAQPDALRLCNLKLAVRDVSQTFKDKPGCTAEDFSGKVQTLSVVPAKLFYRGLHTAFCVFVVTVRKNQLSARQTLWCDSSLSMFTRRNACKTASQMDLDQVRPDQALGTIPAQTW